MLFYLFIYRSDSGLLLYEKDLLMESQYETHLFGNLFSALKMFLSELAIEGLKNLNTVGLGHFTAFIIDIWEMNLDLVIIADKKDGKIIKKLSPDLKKTVLTASELFTSTELDSSRFEDFDQKINSLILSQKNLVGKSNKMDNWDEILKPIYEQKGELSKRLRRQKEEEKRELAIEKEKLKTKLDKEKNIIKKYWICNKILSIIEEIDDKIAYQTYKELARILYFQLEERKVKLYHQLYKTKKSLRTLIENKDENSIITANFHEVYTNLYAFSSGLKNYATDVIYSKYIALTRSLVNINKYSINEIRNLIDMILNIEEDIESYFPIIN